MLSNVKWVNTFMAFLCAANFVVASIRTVVLLSLP